VTFAAFYADWSPRQVWLSSTRENADLATSGVTFGQMPLRSIRRSHVEAWVKQMSATLAPTTIDTRFTIVRGVFRAAVADRLIPSDPSVGVVLPRKRKAEAAMSIPTNADVAKLLNAAEPPNRPKSRPGFTAYVALCAFAGLRRGEALGVQVGDIDFLARTLRVKRQIQRAKSVDVAAGKDIVGAVAGITVIVRRPKYESERTIYLPDELLTILAEHLRQHTPEGEPDRWLFDDDGKPWHDNLVDYRWRSTRIDAGLTYKLHELRHYFASGLIAAGCDVVTVQRAMGHASATTTLSTYAHLWPTAEDKTRAAASGMAAAVLATSLPQFETQ
jgi:integrase